MTRDDDVFAEALALPASDRRAFVVRACGSDDGLRARVEALLAFDQSEAFLQKPLTAHAVITAEERPGELIGRYKLLQKIGEGGMGVVYLASQEEPVRRQVALKIIKLGMDTRAVVARFEAERQALAMMDHPNIARVLDGGATNAGRPYFVMELVRGVRITEYSDEARLSTRERLGLFIQVCQAIQHAHQKGIIHRDIKPSNILVTINDSVAVPKVIDFGIAKAIPQLQERLTDKTLVTQFEALIGTPAYMSPEQIVMTSVDVDTRCDIYSLGVLLYEMLSGRTPFDTNELLASGLDAMRKTIREREPVRPSTRLATLQGEELTTTAKRRSVDTSKLLHQLRGDLDWIVMKCLEKDRARRYETANGLACDLKRYLNNEPVVARPPSAGYRFQKAFRRNRLIFTAVMSVAIALVVGLGISIRQTFAAWDAQQEAEVARAAEQEQRLQAQSAQKIADAQALKAFESHQQSRRLLYASDMNLAQQSFLLNNLGKARRLLERHRPQAGEADLRGWEWRYLWQRTRSEALVTLTQRPARGFALSFSPNGTRLAVGWWDGRVDLWDVPGRRWVRTLSGTEYHHAGRVAFSPVRNLLAATSEPKVVGLYDLDSGRESILWRAPDLGVWSVRDLAFSPDGSKLVIYTGSTRDLGDEVCVVNVATAQIESRHPTIYSYTPFHGAARISADNRKLYLARSDAVNSRYSIQCLDLTTGDELWQTAPERDIGLSTLDVSPDGRVLASGSGLEDSAIRIWDAATGRLLRRLDGHTGWVCKLAFTRDGRRLISAGSDQVIRIWDTTSWTEIQVLRGHTDTVHALAVSESAQLLASASKDGHLLLWRDNGKSAANGYSRLPEDLRLNNALPLDDSRFLFLSSGKPPELADLKGDFSPVVLPEIASSTDVFGWFGANTLCHWNGTGQICVRELRDAGFVLRGAVSLDSGVRPEGVAYNEKHQLVAWTEGGLPASVYLASLVTPERRIELKSDVSGLAPFSFSDDGSYLAGRNKERNSLRVWKVQSGEIVASANGRIRSASFAAGGRVLVVLIEAGNNHEVEFYDLANPELPPRRVEGRHRAGSLAVSPDGSLVASPTDGGEVRLFDPVKGEWLGSLHGHRLHVSGIAFSANGQRLISSSAAQEAVKVWDVGTRQELLTLSGIGSFPFTVRWSADGDVILVGPPWQAWRAPSWEEIAAAEANEKIATE